MPKHRSPNAAASLPKCVCMWSMYDDILSEDFKLRFEDDKRTNEYHHTYDLCRLRDWMDFRSKELCEPQDCPHPHWEQVPKSAPLQTLPDDRHIGHERIERGSYWADAKAFAPIWAKWANIFVVVVFTIPVIQSPLSIENIAIGVLLTFLSFNISIVGMGVLLAPLENVGHRQYLLQKWRDEYFDAIFTCAFGTEKIKSLEERYGGTLGAARHLINERKKIIENPPLFLKMRKQKPKGEKP